MSHSRSIRWRVTRLVLASLLVGGGLLWGCVGPEGPGQQESLRSLWVRYEKLEPERALAVAGDPELRWVGAATGGHATRESAERTALEDCRKRRARQRMQDACRLYAVGDEVVWPLR